MTTPLRSPRSVNGTKGGYSMTNVHPKPISLMVAKKVERPPHIVLDANKVKDAWTLSTGACATGGLGCEHFDLMAAMENYFTTVQVVDGAQPLPSTPHIVADVKIDDMKINGLVRGGMTYAIIEMNWGFALRPNDQEEYAYSFAGLAQSNDSCPTFEAGCAQLVENAIPAMLEKWTEDGGISRLRTTLPHDPPHDKEEVVRTRTGPLRSPIGAHTLASR